jgi:peptidyl-tRNA hydrolase
MLLIIRSTLRTLAASLFVAGLFAQTPPAQTNRVLAILTVNDGVTREQMAKVMPVEVRATVQMYLDGRIEQWFSRGDGKGVVFIMDCKTVEEAKSLTDSLPLSKAKFVTFEYMTLGPLTPLRLLIGTAPQ